jgi:hypothetical protein
MSDKIKALIQETPEVQSKAMTFRQTVPSGQEYTLQDISPMKGTIKQLTMHFPPGCNLLVKMKVKRSGIAFFPVLDYIALDNATPTYYCNQPIALGEPIQVVIRNEDAMNPHTPTVIFVIEG